MESPGFNPSSTSMERAVRTPVRIPVVSAIPFLTTYTCLPFNTGTTDSAGTSSERICFMGIVIFAKAPGKRPLADPIQVARTRMLREDCETNGSVA